MEIRDRKRVIFFVRIGLIFATVVFVASWIGGKVRSGVRGAARSAGITSVAPAPDGSKLSPGDMQIISTDGAIDATLQGDKILVGLSTAKLEEVRKEMAKDNGNDSGLGAVIAGAVKSSVANAIGTHAVFNLSNVQSLTYDHSQLVLTTSDGEAHNLKGTVQTDKGKKSVEFSKADAERFIEAVNARKRELGIP